MIITKKHLSRRTFLRGTFGTMVALPLLDAMVPALTAQTAARATAPFRFAADWTLATHNLARVTFLPFAQRLVDDAVANLLLVKARVILGAGVFQGIVLRVISLNQHAPGPVAAPRAPCHLRDELERSLG